MISVYPETELYVKNANSFLFELLNIGESLLADGAEVNRVEDTLTRMGKAYGAEKMNVFVITSSIIVTMILRNGEKVTQTRRILNSCGNDFTRLEALNALSRAYCANPFSTQEVAAKVQEITQDTPSKQLLYLGCSLAAGGYAVFFGGNLLDGILAALCGLLIYFMQDKLSPICPNLVTYNVLCSFCIGCIICSIARLSPLLHIDKIMIGDIMLLIPGIAMTNSLKDILVGDTIFGIMRLIETCLWASALACGFMLSIWLIGG